MNKARQKLTEEQITAITCLVKTDMSFAKIAQSVGVSESSVQRIAKNVGISRYSPVLKKKEEPVEKPVEEQEEIIKCGDKHLERLLRKWNWKKPELKKTNPENTHSEFRTPYNYPRKWGKDGRR